LRICKSQLVRYFCTCVKLGHERLPRVEELHEITSDVLEQKVLTHLADQQRGLELTESAAQLSQYLYFCTTVNKYFCTIKATCSRSGHSAAAQTRGGPSYIYIIYMYILYIIYIHIYMRVYVCMYTYMSIYV
jgi:hypothetical protein